MVQKLVAVSVLLLSVAGCGGSDQQPPGRPKTVAVSGTLTYKGAPVEGAQVNFVPGSPADAAAYAVTKADGTFSLSTFGTNDGAAPGAYQVTVSKREVKTIPNSVDPNGPPQGTEEKSFLPKKYASVSTTSLKVDVPADGKKDVNLELND